MENNNTNKESKNWIKTYIVDVLPCISVAFFVLAFIYTDSFYTVFGIDIVKYTTFGDVFMSITMPIVVFALFASIILSFIYDLFSAAFPESIRRIESRKPTLTSPFGIKCYCLRKLVKIKNTKICKSFFFEKKNKSSSKGIFAICIITFLLYVACGYFYINCVREEIIRPTLLSCAFALLIPLLLLPIPYYVTTVSQYKWSKRKNIDLKPQKSELIVLGIGYYIYAISMFNIIGREEGMNVRYNNHAEFEIVTSKGNIYDNSQYIYIGHLSEQTFLLEKRNGRNIILNNEGIISTKIKDNKQQKDSFSSLLDLVYEKTLKHIDPYLRK